jgi:peptidoglycan/xylan/chitin deacetylase (PgdA/CDA1 family)
VFIFVPNVCKFILKTLVLVNNKMFYLLFATSMLIAIGMQTMWLIPEPKGIRILMYHKISTNVSDFLTITCEQLENQLKYLNEQNYQFITAQQLIDFYLYRKALPPNPVLLTFDDGYVSIEALAYPILKQYQAKATLFLPSAFLGATNRWDDGDDPIMSIDQLKNLCPVVFELALHSHEHQNYNHLTPQQIENDLQINIDFFKNNQINYTPAFAYPYGGYPKNVSSIFKRLGVLMAFRIRNQINSFIINDLYAVKRIDIRGTDTFDDFKLKVKKGRTKFIL